MYIEKNEIKIIKLEKEIKVFYIDGEWNKIDETIKNAKHKKIPETNYGISVAAIGKSHGPDGKYIVGTEVTSFEEQNDAYSTFTIPEGKYIQYTFNAENFDKLIADLFGRFKNMKKWAAENVINGNWDGIIVEIYPADVKTTKYPEMSIIRPIKDN